jgi:hypothetical protein
MEAQHKKTNEPRKIATSLRVYLFKQIILRKEREAYQRTLDENYLRMAESFLNEDFFLIEKIDDNEEERMEKKRKLKAIEAPAKRMKIDTSLCDMS